MGDTTAVGAKVQAYLQDLELKYMVEGAGEYSLRYNSIQMFIRVWTRDPNETSSPTHVRLMVPLLFGPEGGPELYEYIAFHSDDYVFGHLSLFRTDEGELRVFYTHTLLGDYLDAEEFNRALIGMANVADNLDDELQARFGGTRFHNES